MDEPTPQNLEEAQQLIDELRATNQRLDATTAQLTATVDQQQRQIAWLTRQMFGRKSERLAQADEPALFDGVAGAEAAPPEPPEAEPETQAVTYRRRAAKRGKRSPIPDHLPRVDRVHDLPEEEKAGMKWIGQETSEELEMEPGRVYVVRHIRYTYARIEQDPAPEPAQPNVVTAPKPAEGLDRCIAGPSLLAQIMIGKFADHAPLHRLEQILRRSHVQIPRSSMCRWAQDVAEMLTPLMRRMKARVLSSHVIQADETPVKQQERGRGRTKTCYFYSYVGDEAGPYVLYDYQGGRSRAGPNGWFSDRDGKPNYHGLLQCDAYTGYRELFDPDEPWRMTHVGCWGHVRRKFYDVRDQFPGPCHHVLGQIRQLYAVEREAKERDLDASQRQALREETSRPIVER
jgi:transposase